MSRNSLPRRSPSLDNDSSNIAQRPKKKQTQYHHIIYKDALFFPTQGDRLIESPIFSNLTLQKLMYFNIYYDFLFFYLLLVVFLYKIYVFQSHAFHIVRPILLVVWAFLEAFRFWNGYKGNLNESFPDLFFYNLLTCIACVLVIVMLIFGKAFPLEIACEVIFLVFGILQILVGYYTMMRLSVSQEALFYLRSANSQIRVKKDEKETNKEIEMVRRESQENQGGLRRRKSKGQGYQPLRQEE